MVLLFSLKLVLAAKRLYQLLIDLWAKKYSTLSAKFCPSQRNLKPTSKTGSTLKFEEYYRLLVLIAYRRAKSRPKILFWYYWQNWFNRLGLKIYMAATKAWWLTPLISSYRLIWSTLESELYLCVRHLIRIHTCFARLTITGMN